MKTQVILYLLLLNCLFLLAQNKKISINQNKPTIIASTKIAYDCKDAVKININKNSIYGPTVSPNGFGTIQEITSKANEKKYFEQEHNSSWYLLNINNDGDLAFQIIPKDSSNDYDFLLYKYIDSTFCDALLNKKLSPIRSNLSRNNIETKGYTGISINAKNDFVGKGPGESYSKSIYVTKGEKYGLILDNVYPNGKGHTIKFVCQKTKEIKFKGKIINPDSIPIPATISINDDAGNQILERKANTKGEYNFSAKLVENQNYTMIYEYDNSFMAAKTINTKTIKDSSGTYPYIQTILPKLKKGNKYNLGVIQFYGGTSNLLPISHPSVYALYKLMKKNKKMIIQIEGHVNDPKNDQSEEENLKLSKNRAQVIYDYLVNMGINKDRCSSIGLGSTQMLYPNAKNEGEEQANRRVEIKVISINGE